MIVFYQKLRLDTVQRLLTYLSIKIIEVVIATGFINAAHFSSVFSARFIKEQLDHSEFSHQLKP